MSKATEAKATPGLKLQTPIEQRKTAVGTYNDRKRWEWLFHPDRNKWRPIK